MSIFNYVQSTSTAITASGSLGTLTMSAASTAGNLMLVISATGTGTVSSIVDNLTSTYGQNILNGNLIGYTALIGSSGTATLTLTSPSASANRIYYAAEYTIPTNFWMSPDRDLPVTTLTTGYSISQYYGAGSIGSPVEGLALVAALNTNTSTVWAISSGNVRGTINSGAQSVIVYDVGFTPIAATYPLFTTNLRELTTLTQTGSGGVGQMFIIDFLAYNTSTFIAPTGSFAYIQGTSAISTATITMTAVSTLGDIIIAANAGYHATMATSVTDNLGNTYNNYGVVFQGGIGAAGTLSVFIATSVKAGTATVTFNGASTTNNDLIVAEYKIPSATVIVDAIANMAQPGTGTIWPYSYDVGAISGTVNNLAMIPIVYNDNNVGSWAMSTGTVRVFTTEADGATLMLGDVIIANPATTTHTTTITNTAEITGAWITCPVNLISVTALGTTTTTGGGAGLVSERGWSGGFEG